MLRNKLMSYLSKGMFELGVFAFDVYDFKVSEISEISTDTDNRLQVVISENKT